MKVTVPNCPELIMPLFSGELLASPLSKISEMFGYNISNVHKRERKMMKLVPIIMFLCFYSASGQLLPGGQLEDYEAKKSADGHSSAFISLMIRSTKIGDGNPLELGGNIKFINKNNISLGFTFFTKVSTDVTLSFPNSPDRKPFLTYSYGGFDIGYFVKINDYLNLNFSTMFGTGTLSYNYSASVLTLNIVDTDWFYMAEPRASLGIKIYGRYYLELSAAFRLTADAEFYNINNGELSGPVFGGGVRINLY